MAKSKPPRTSLVSRDQCPARNLRVRKVIQISKHLLAMVRSELGLLSQFEKDGQIRDAIRELEAILELEKRESKTRNIQTSQSSEADEFIVKMPDRIDRGLGILARTIAGILRRWKEEMEAFRAKLIQYSEFPGNLEEQLNGPGDELQRWESQRGITWPIESALGMTPREIFRIERSAASLMVYSAEMSALSVQDNTGIAETSQPPPEDDDEDEYASGEIPPERRTRHMGVQEAAILMRVSGNPRAKAKWLGRMIKERKIKNIKITRETYIFDINDFANEFLEKVRR